MAARHPCQLLIFEDDDSDGGQRRTMVIGIDLVARIDISRGNIAVDNSGVAIQVAIVTREVGVGDRSLLEELSLLFPLLWMRCHHHNGKHGTQAYVCAGELHFGG